jgi:hypothetical protein
MRPAAPLAPPAENPRNRTVTLVSCPAAIRDIHKLADFLHTDAPIPCILGARRDPHSRHVPSPPPDRRSRRCRVLPLRLAMHPARFGRWFSVGSYAYAAMSKHLHVLAGCLTCQPDLMHIR